MTDTPSIHRALSDVKRALPSIPKGDVNKDQGYKFQGIASIVAHIKPLLAEHGVNIVPSVIERLSERLPSASGKTLMHEVNLHVEFSVFGPAGDSLIGSAWGEARDASDKATPKAMTSAYKAFLRQLLDIAEYEPDEDADAGSPEVRARDEVDWFVANGWADQAVHDQARHQLIERIQLQADDVRAEIKESCSRAGISFARGMTVAEIDTITSWLPSESRETPPAAQDGPAPADSGQPLPGEYPEAPEGITHERWQGALAVVDSMRLSDLMASLADHGLGTKGTEGERRVRLAVAIASEPVPN